MFDYSERIGAFRHTKVRLSSEFLEKLLAHRKANRDRLISQIADHIPGLGNEILRLTQRRDETWELMAEPVHPERGVLVAVTKTKPHGAKYPAYSLSVGRQPAPMDAILDKTDPEELEVMRPLEDVIHHVTDAEEWEFLGKVLPPHHLEGLRHSLQR